jgi:hypothetical protein
MSESINSKQEAIEGIVNKRLKDLCDFLEEMKEGTVRQAKALWTMNRVHLSEHPVNHYFRTAIDAGVIDVDASGHFTFKYNPFKAAVKPVAEQKPHRESNAEKIDRLINARKSLKQKMKAGPCKDFVVCPDGYCTKCTGYNLWRQENVKTDNLQGQGASDT